jgi:hypothetical protein
MFQYKKTLILSVAGSDDRQDWKENIMIMTIKRLWYAYKGFALPAENIVKGIKNYCIAWDININKISIEQSCHSRGGAIGAIIHKALSDEGIKINTFAWGSAYPGGCRFFNRAQTNTLCRFEIKGDPVPHSNPFGKHIGVKIELPRQIHGFFNRIKGFFKGDINHRSYDCIKNIEPYCNW